jgi:PAS domain S-box-containing protein/putative nucleotidyltransferase with HDIG domain
VFHGVKRLETLRGHLFALVLATLVPGATLLGYSVYEGAQHSIAEAKSSLRTLARITAVDTSEFLATNRESMALLAKRPLVKALDGTRCDPVIYEFRDLFPRFANLTTITLDGTAVCSAVPQPGGKPVNVGKTEWFRRALTERRFLAGDPFIGPITGRWVSVLVAPIRDEQDALKGFVGLPLDLKLYAPSIKGTQLAPGMRAGIISANGHLIWRTEDQEKFVGKYIGEFPVAKAALATKEGDFEGIGLDGIHRIYAATPIPEVDWYVYVGIPSAPLYGRAFEDGRRIAIYGLLGLIAALALATLLARRITRAIGGISKAALAIKAGERAVRAPVNGPREFTDLAVDFNVMVDTWMAALEERKRAEVVRTQLAAIVQSSHDAIVGKDLDGVVTSWNPGAEKVYGYRAEEVVGKPVSMLAPEGKKDEIAGLLERVKRGEAVTSYETERYRKDGRRIDIELDLSPIRDASDRIVGVSTIARDITEKKRADRALRKVNRALKVLSSGNAALVHAKDEMQLLGDMCRVIAEAEGYRMAWVGYAEHDPAKTVKPVAQSGGEPDILKSIDASWADDERGSGPVGVAIRTGRIQVVQDVTKNARLVRAARLGHGSVLVAPLAANSHVLGALSIHAAGTNAFDDSEIALLSELAADMAYGIVMLRTRSAHEQDTRRLEQSMEATISSMAATMEKRDPYTAGHQRRVADLATAIAHDMGLAEDRVYGIRLAGIVHDLGKIQIPAEILTKPGRLAPIEFELVKDHPQVGYEILKGIDFPWPIAEIVRQHHERLDGSGYPRGLQGDEILLEARIMMVADVMEAMASHRPYRAALGPEAALEEIAANAGKYYDPGVVATCTKLFREKGYAFPAFAAAA